METRGRKTKGSLLKGGLPIRKILAAGGQYLDRRTKLIPVPIVAWASSSKCCGCARSYQYFFGAYIIGVLLKGEVENEENEEVC